VLSILGFGRPLWGPEDHYRGQAGLNEGDLTREEAAESLRQRIQRFLAATGGGALTPALSYSVVDTSTNTVTVLNAPGYVYGVFVNTALSAHTVVIKDATAAIASMGFSGRQGEHMVAVFATPEEHHLVVCTLCSCYPRAVLGYPPFWFKSAAYRARAVRDPRGLLTEFGTTLPAAVRLRVVDSTADYRWMVLPLRPAGTEGWSEARLAAIVREGDMIGVTLPTIAHPTSG
jgi:nitrile hydratase